MRAKEFITESRTGLYRLLKREFPTWPDYVVKDFLLGRMGKAKHSGYPVMPKEKEEAKKLATRGDGQIDLKRYQDLILQAQEKRWAESLIPHIRFLQQQYPVKRWTKDNTYFTFDSWDAATQSKLAAMAGEDPRKLANKIPRHTKRIGTQQELLKRKGLIKEPIIVILHPRKSINASQGGFELLEGHHRIISVMRQYGQLGFYAPAYIGHVV